MRQKLGGGDGFVNALIRHVRTRRREVCGGGVAYAVGEVGVPIRGGIGGGFVGGEGEAHTGREVHVDSVAAGLFRSGLLIL